MSFPPLRLLIQTPEQTILDQVDVHWTQVQLADGGAIGIWPGHAPLLAETAAGSLRYADSSGEHELLLQAGILQIAVQGITIYTVGLASVGDLARPVHENKQAKRLQRLAAALYRPSGR